VKRRRACNHTHPEEKIGDLLFISGPSNADSA
jgi:hypothetical protein